MFRSHGSNHGFQRRKDSEFVKEGYFFGDFFLVLFVFFFRFLVEGRN